MFHPGSSLVLCLLGEKASADLQADIQAEREQADRHLCTLGEKARRRYLDQTAIHGLLGYGKQDVLAWVVVGLESE